MYEVFELYSSVVEERKVTDCETVHGKVSRSYESC